MLSRLSTAAPRRRAARLKKLLDVRGYRPMKRDSRLPQAIIDLGDSFGLQVVAEGIEHEFQRRRLLELGCRLGQGHRFGRPMPAAKPAALLRPTTAAAPF